MIITPTLFKDIVARFTTGVTVITTSYEDKLYGLTANSFTSVSLDPLLILFCISKNSGSYQAFINCQFFNINFLRADQEDIAKHFASRILDKYQGIDYRLGKYDQPLINNSLGYMEAEKYAIYDAGDHSIILGKVLEGDIDKERKVLSYHDRKFIIPI